MNLQEYFKHCGVIKVTKGFGTTYEKLENVVGNQVWICDYRNSEKGADLKPIRNIKPTLVQVCRNDEKNRVYYSPVHFREVKENGKLNSRVIAPYDNTGYRALTGTSLNIFDTQEECIQCFNRQLGIAINDVMKQSASLARHFKNILQDLRSMIIEG